ncbi:unnamed protein product [Plasmodium vivax]|uniref:(malaria parasite P. vivax) hypothetical protein n=1 Tax=Plasmodium vivax TaxID=5855 RepID=A0A8S4HJ85_PLAVI|nr:unnamed protein product [Plasmodium vivax]CAI7721744.1 PIR protein [Plasmodium vivax]
MTKHATVENYLNYDDYYKYYSKFNPYYVLSELDEEKLTKLMNESTDDAYVKQKLKDVFKELSRHIHNHGVFYDYSPKACWYICYVLHKFVENKFYENYDEKLFNIFHNFLIKYNLQYSYRSGTCVNDMVYTNSNIFKEMDALYRTYDDYKKFLSDNKYKNENTCGQLKNFVYVYNVYVNSNKSKSSRFNSILENFEKNLKKTLQEYNDYCGSNNYSLSKLQLYTEPEKKPPKLEAAEVLPKPSPLTSSPQKGLEPERPNHIDTSENQEELPLSPPRENQVTHEDPINELHTETGPENETRHDIPIERRTQSQSQYAQPLEQRYLETFNVRGQPYNPRENVLSAQLPLEKGDEGILGRMKGAFSSISDYVEPVPLMAVSGGMGALFLLLRYTPVGTSFRGRRGRTYGIPSGFNGPFPGEFPGYQDYLGGNIGYTQMNPLAE